MIGSDGSGASSRVSRCSCPDRAVEVSAPSLKVLGYSLIHVCARLWLGDNPTSFATSLLCIMGCNFFFFLPLLHCRRLDPVARVMIGSWGFYM
ncbi:hypothetical protein BDM02DRAFT_1548196 [Thelephora ganbajun]|uniref:Uncharacterized protein n=1 Tax=Thelephora ganbajun TaxID=370292 RepID=A0ACB6Z1J6_THEGA|nr:hypothetical protein BDM02DRAFT_1548196 [Thelephora ganbajun]